MDELTRKLLEKCIREGLRDFADGARNGMIPGMIVDGDQEEFYELADELWKEYRDDLLEWLIG